MRAVAHLIAAVVVALGIVQSLKKGAGDRSVLATPPEAIAEQFMRQLETRRFVRALPMLSDDAAGQVDENDLRQMTEDVENAWGKIKNVTGERVSMSDTLATATAELETVRQEVVPLYIVLRWEQGEWKVHQVNARAQD